MNKERELKYLIKPKKLMECFYMCKTFYDSVKVEQGYINEARIRRYGDVDMFSWKLRVTETESFEIEQVLNPTEFNLLWERASDKHKKHRFMLDLYDAKLDIDFFYSWWHNEPYIATVEVEMKTDQDVDILDPGNRYDIAKYIHNKVSNAKFSSRKLGDEKYARKLLKEIS